jgi:hypothetical protein
MSGLIFTAYFVTFCTAFIFFAITLLLTVAAFSDDLGVYKGWRTFAISLSLVLAQIYGYSEYFAYSNNQTSIESTQKAADELIKWQAAGCPVYQSECGSKHKSACEKKASVIGRNQVGDTFVQAHGLCVK